MATTSFITGGFAIPFVASIGATYYASSVVNTSNEEQQKKKYIEEKIKIVKEAFEEYKKNEDLITYLGKNEHLRGDEIKSFIEDIYICDSEKIIQLEDDKTYSWENIEKELEIYEEKELENVLKFIYIL